MKTKILLMFCVLLLTATPAMAIPSAGQYVWAPGGPLTGTFTSDGTQLTAFDFLSTGSTAHWTTVDAVFINSIASLDSVDNATPPIVPTLNQVLIFWNTNPNVLQADQVSESDGRVTVDSFIVPFTPARAEPIPEPTTLMLLSTGLVGLVGYRWRQGRREGQQVR